MRHGRWQRWLARGLWLAVVVWFVALPVVSHQRARVWHDNLSLWSDAHRKAPRAPRPAIDLGREFELRGYHDDALVMAHTATALASQPSPFSEERRRQWQVIALTNYARLLAMRGQYDRAQILLTEALSVIPNSPMARYESILVAWFQGRCQQTSLTPNGHSEWQCPIGQFTP